MNVEAGFNLDNGKRLYANGADSFESHIVKSHENNDNISFKIYENAHILPLVRLEHLSGAVYSGGVCDVDFTFIAGYKRKDVEKPLNLECIESYIPDITPDYVDSDVVYGGVLLHQFGHFLIESLCRLWYAIEHKKKNQKLIFLQDKPLNKNFLKLITLSGISLEDIIILDKPTQFRSVTVPEQSLHFFSNFSKNFKVPYEAITKNITPSNFKKIYLSRTKLEKKDCINEEYFENFYKDIGFHIVYPETLSLEEQISIISGADVIVSIIGTLSHLSIFAKKGVRVISLLRARNYFNMAQQLIFESKEQQYTYVDATFNFLPSDYGTGCYFFAPTESWKKFVKDEYGILIEQSLTDYLNNSQSVVGDYIQLWMKKFDNKNAMAGIKSYTSESILSNLKNAFR